MGQKQKAHSLLESMIRQCAVTAKDHKAVIEIPYFEMSRELGFADQTPMGCLRITLIAEYIDEEQDLYEKESGFTTKDSTPKQ